MLINSSRSSLTSSSSIAGWVCGTDLDLRISAQTQSAMDRNRDWEKEEESFFKSVVLLLRSRIRRREDLGSASESEALQLSCLSQEAIHRWRHDHPHPPGPQGIRHQGQSY
ncbi:hypothetical protein SESBI_40156 [Sesbania bispinosa]|nr:hypothetical protein SESBI_40156 [Sesbania bispinosa]